MKKAIVVVSLLLALPAHAQTYQTFTSHSGNGFWNSMTYGPGGEMYQTFGNPYGSMTYGPNGYSAQTFSNPYGSMTYVHPGWGGDDDE